MSALHDARDTWVAIRANTRRRDLVFVSGMALTAALSVAVPLAVRERARVDVLNGLDVPVDVVIGERAVHLEPGARQRVATGTGVFLVKTRTARGVIEELALRVPPFKDAVVYNVLGVAPLYRAQVEYSASLGGGRGNVKFLGGERLYVEASVDHVFVQPPQTISVKRGARTWRSHVDVAKGGWHTTWQYLEQEGELERAARVATSVLEADPTSTVALERAAALTAATGGVEASLALLRSAIAQNPTSVPAHLAYQRAMRVSGQSTRVRDEYAALAAKQPDSLPMAVLAAQAEPGVASRAALEALHARHPDDPAVQLALARCLLREERGEEAAELFAKAARGAPALYDQHVEEHARALVFAGKPSEGAKVLAASLSAALDPHAWRPAMTYAQIAALPRVTASPRGDTFFRRLSEGRPGIDAFLAVRLGEATSFPKVENTDTRAALEIAAAAARDPAAAWQACSRAPARALREVPSEVALLLGLELGRAGDVGLANALFEAGVGPPIPLADIVAYAHGGDASPELVRLDPEWRAAADLVRARALEARGAPAEALYASAARRDPLRGPIYRAVNAWPRLAPASAAVVGGKRK